MEEEKNPEKRSQESQGGSLFHTLKKRLERTWEKARRGFKAHFVSWISVNAFLLLIYVMTTFGAHPWFLYPLAGWGIGLLIHYGNIRQIQKQRQEFDRFGPLNDWETALLKQIQKRRRGYAGHLYTTVAVSGFLFMVNLITSPSFLWALIPSAGLVASLFIHRAGYRDRTKKLRQDFLASLENTLPNRFQQDGSLATARQGKIDTGSSAVPPEAEQLKERLQEQIKTLGQGHELVAEEIRSLTEQYYAEIRKLAEKDASLSGALAGEDEQARNRRIEELDARIKSTDDDDLRKEYERAVEELRAQDKSVRKVMNQREIINLRIGSAITSLRRINLDLTRMLSAQGLDEEASMDMLREKGEELSRFLEDLHEGYSEL